MQRRPLVAGTQARGNAPSSKNTKLIGARMRRAIAAFNNIAHVIISSDASIFPARARGAARTCKWFCRCAGCEHVECAPMLALRLQK